MKVGVLASGAGTNLQVLLDDPVIDVAAVGVNRADAIALERAGRAGVAAEVFALEDFPDRAARDVAMADWLVSREVTLVVLAGYMQLVTPSFLARFPDAVINVHPALLPAFPGIGSIEQALAYGVKVFGVTVHYVDEGVDSGAVIAQRAIALPGVRDRHEVHHALQPLEHELLPAVVRAIAAGRVRRDPDHPRRILVDEPSF